MPVSVWQTVFRNFHTPLVRSPADRTKVVTPDGCTPKIYRVRHVLSFNFFPAQQRLQCLSQLEITNCFRLYWAQSRCLPDLFHCPILLFLPLPALFFPSRRVFWCSGWHGWRGEQFLWGKWRGAQRGKGWGSSKAFWFGSFGRLGSWGGEFGRDEVF